MSDNTGGSVIDKTTSLCGGEIPPGVSGKTQEEIGFGQDDIDGGVTSDQRGSADSPPSPEQRQTLWEDVESDLSGDDDEMTESAHGKNAEPQELEMEQEAAAKDKVADTGASENDETFEINFNFDVLDDMKAPWKRRKKKQVQDEELSQTYQDDTQCKHVMAELRNQTLDGTFCDVKLKAHGQIYHAHRCVLAASGFLLHILVSETESDVIDVSNDVASPEILQLLLQYVYTGDLQINIVLLRDLFSASVALGLAKVIELCEDYMLKHIHEYTWLQILLLSKKHDLKEVQKKTVKFICDSLQKIYRTGEFLEMTQEELEYAFTYKSSYKISNRAAVEKNKLDAIVHWTIHDYANRNSGYPSLLGCVNADMISQASLESCFRQKAIRTHEIFNHKGTIGFIEDVRNMLTMKLAESLRDLLPRKRGRPTKGTKKGGRKTAKNDLLGRMSKVERHHRHKLLENFIEKNEALGKQKNRGKGTSEIPVGEETIGEDKAMEEIPAVEAEESSSKHDTESAVNEGTVYENLKCAVAENADPEQNVQLETQEVSADSNVQRLNRSQVPLLLKRAKGISGKRNWGVVNEEAAHEDIEPGAAVNAESDQNVESETQGSDDSRAQRLDGSRVSLKEEEGTSRELNRHVNLECAQCKKQFATRRQLTRHMHSHGLRTIHCEHCQYSTNRKNLLHTHIRKRHVDVALELGYIDEATYVYRTSKPIAKPTKTEITVPKGSLIKHRLGDMLQCPKCPRRFLTPSKLTHHMRGHGAENPFLCDLCGYSTRHFSTMYTHKKLHKGLQYVCPYENCSYTNMRKSRYDDHISMHKGIKNFQCVTCGKAFVNRKHLYRHEKLHSEVKPHACEECEYRSVRKDKLHDHLRKHHPDLAVTKGILDVAKLLDPQFVAGLKIGNRSSATKRKSPRKRAKKSSGQSTEDIAEQPAPLEVKATLTPSATETLSTETVSHNQVLPAPVVEQQQQSNFVTMTLPLGTSAINEDMLQYLASMTTGGLVAASQPQIQLATMGATSNNLTAQVVQAPTIVQTPTVVQNPTVIPGQSVLSIEAGALSSVHQTQQEVHVVPSTLEQHGDTWVYHIVPENAGS